LPIVLFIWMITNGIWYFFAFAPVIPSSLQWAARAYIAFLWLPSTPEKIVIVIISPFIYRLIYREDFKKEKNHDNIENKS